MLPIPLAGRVVDMQSHYGDVVIGAMVSLITCLTIVKSIVYSGADQRKHQSFASLAFVRGIHRGPVNSPHKWPVTRKMFPFDDVIMPTDKNQATLRVKKYDIRYKVNDLYIYVNKFRQ